MTARDPRTGRTAEGRSVRAIAEALEISVGSVHGAGRGGATVQ